MLALLFPGQGSQRPGMGAPWRDHPSWALVERLSEELGRDLGALLLNAGAEELQATRNAQLAVYTLSLVALDAVMTSRLGTEVRENLTAVAGHSLGEYTALVAAGALGATEGALLVQARGEAMQAAAQASPGTMAAVLGLGPPEVVRACGAVRGAWVANDNAPGQVVVAGTFEGVEKAGAAALALGAKRVLPLKVGGAFHTPLMSAAQAPLDAAVKQVGFSAPSCPVVANFDAQPHLRGFGELLAAQLCSQVRWRESLMALAARGAQVFIELGPGAELSGMAKRTVPEAARANVAAPDDLGPLADRLAAGATGSPVGPGEGSD
jgi:[acyl-carrier-protein] S-malonyltransferase